MTCYLTKRAATPHPLRRPEIKRLRARLAHVIRGFFIRQAPKLIGQIVTLRGKQPFVKAALSDEERRVIDEIIASLDFTGWAVLVGEVDDIIEDAVKDGSYVSLAELGIDVNARREVMNIVSADALEYARERSAAMVGMRFNDAGDLIPNPNADWQITEGTRDLIRGDVLSALEEGVSNDVLANRLSDAYAFSDQRAMTIARTETIRASNQGALTGYKASGVVELKQWTTAEDDRVSEDCEENGNAGPIALDAEFPSGDDAPPAHPNCRCVIVPIVTFASEEPTPEEQES